LNLGDGSSATGGFVDGHLDGFLPVADDDRAQRGVLGVDHGIVDRPEAMELQHLLIPTRRLLHLQVGLVADAMVREAQTHRRPIVTIFPKDYSQTSI
jgi:hypothetical protein